MFKIYDEAETPMRGRVEDIGWAGIAKRRGVFEIYEEQESPNEGACLRYIMSRKRQMRRHVVDICGNGIAECGGRVVDI